MFIRSILLAAIASCLFAQTNRGGISGTVFDSSGATIPGATVTVTNLGTNQKIRLSAKDGGSFSALDLDPVDYRIEVEADGFKKTVVQRVKVDTGNTARIDVTLQPGAVDSSIQVVAEQTSVNTESGTAGNTITERQIMDTPLVNRSVLDLAVLLPNVSGDVGSENPAVTSGAPLPGYNLSLNGGRPGSTSILADGVNNTGVGMARAVVSFSPETIQEFSVQTSAYSAEYGQTGGGVISATTKSGTNRLTGVAMWLMRNPATNAAPFTTATVNRPVSNLRDNQTSFSAGGPVVIPKLYNGRNRTFFFGAYEPRRRQDRIQAEALQATDAMRGGNFSGLTAVTGGWAPTDIVNRFGIRSTGDSTIYQQFNSVGNQLQLQTLAAGQTYIPFPNNTIPKSMLDPVAVKALDYAPKAGDYYVNSNGALVNWSTQRFVKQNENRYLVRLDHNLSDRNRLNFRITVVPAVGQKGFGSDINGNGADYSASRQLMMADTHTFSPRVVNDFRANYTRGRFSGTYTPEFDIKTGRNLTKELGLPSLTVGGLPQFSFGLGSFGNIGSAGSTQNDNVEERYNITDIVYVNRGKMSWKFGVDISHALLNVTPLYAASGGNYGFTNTLTNSLGTGSGTGGIAMASYLLGVPTTVAQRNVIIPYYYRWNSGAAFVQNDWKLRPNLTVNLGVRYSLQLPRTEKYNHQGVFLPDLSKSFTVSPPVTLVTGQVISSALIAPFGYSGLDGRSAYLTPARYLDFEPRFGFAYSPRFFGLTRLAIRGGYGMSHAPLTGNNRLANPDFGAAANFGTTSGQVDPNYVMRLSSNPPLIKATSVADYLNIPKDGLVYQNGINIAGFVASQNNHSPLSQNWNLTLAWQLRQSMTIEAAYVGAKGTHLFLPSINFNTRDFDYVNALDAANQNPDNTVNDPLGRIGTTGTIARVPLSSLASKYMGINNLNTFMDASANSIRHATYASVIQRSRTGLTFMANYTFGKSIDDASDASPDKGSLTSGTVGGGQITSGGTRKNDRSVSSFDIKHNFNSTAIYELPFGKGKRYLAGRPAPIRTIVDGWNLAAVFRIVGGFPAVANLEDANFLGGPTHTIRPNIAPGVPILNPLWNRSCPTGNLCEPYLNPAAFVRTPRGQLGNAARTFDWARGPAQRYFDLSIQKNFALGERRRLQFRVDLVNAFNHPVFRVQPSNGGGTDLYGAPITATMTSAEYDTWAKFNRQPLSNTSEGAAQLAQVQQIVIGNRTATGALPNDFFSKPVPQGFVSKDANSFDVTNIEGYKLYRLRQTWKNGGGLYSVQVPRYIQFGLKLFF